MDHRPIFMHGCSTFQPAHATSNPFRRDYGNDSMKVFARDAFRIGQGLIRSLATRTSILLRRLSRDRTTPSSNRMTLWNGKMPTGGSNHDDLDDPANQNRSSLHRS